MRKYTYLEVYNIFKEIVKHGKSILNSGFNLVEFSIDNETVTTKLESYDYNFGELYKFKRGEEVSVVV